jgi:hypothetical protein
MSAIPTTFFVEIPAKLYESDPNFWKRVDIKGPDECWPFKGGGNYDGYCSYRGKGAHRHACALAHGEIPEGMRALHSCDNPQCCNPNHLRIGTQQQNMIEKFQRGRHTDFARKLRPSQVLEIQELRRQGKTSTEIAPIYNVTPGHIRGCCNGRKWPKLAA